MQLAGDQEGIDRIAENDELRRGQCIQGGLEVLLQRLDPLPGMQLMEVVCGELLLQKQAGVQGDGVFALGASVDDQDIHTVQM